MVRVAREQSNTGIYHIMIRGINKQNIFEDIEDREKLLGFLKYFQNICSFDLFSYCIMNNHIHLLIGEIDDTISEVVKRISASFVLWYNKKYDRIGHLFQERFKSEPIHDEYHFLRVIRYIHHNPNKAGLKNRMNDSKWTSHIEYLNKANIVNTQIALELFSENINLAKSEYVKFMNAENDDDFMDVNPKVGINDNQILQVLKGMGIPSISKLQSLDSDKRDYVLKELKKLENTSIRQLARITGISKSVIGRA